LQQQQPTQPMYYQQMPPQAPQRAPSEYLKPLASDFLLVIGIVLGLFLMMLGTLIGDMASRDFGLVLGSFGSFLLTAVLLFGAIIRVDMDKYVRVALILGAALIISSGLVW